MIISILHLSDIIMVSNLAWQAKKNCLYSALNNKKGNRYICDDDDADDDKDDEDGVDEDDDNDD